MNTPETDTTRPSSPPPVEIAQAVRAAREKKATEATVLDLRALGSFTDFFIILTGQHPRQVRAIAEAVEAALGASRRKPSHVEGRDRAEWILLDYFDLIVHVFTPETRAFYALERLWGSAARVDPPDEDSRRLAPAGPG